MAESRQTKTQSSPCRVARPSLPCGAAARRRAGRAGRSCVLSVASEQVRAEQGADGGHVLVLQCVLALALSGEGRLRLGIAQASLALLSACTAFQVVRGEVLARVAAVGGVLALPRRVYAAHGLNEHRVLSLEALQTVVRSASRRVTLATERTQESAGIPEQARLPVAFHAVVVLAMASGKAERALVS